MRLKVRARVRRRAAQTVIPEPTPSPSANNQSAIALDGSGLLFEAFPWATEARTL